jgi:hypothetical protein
MADAMKRVVRANMTTQLIRDLRLAASLWVAGVGFCMAAEAPAPAPAPQETKAARPLPTDARAGDRAAEKGKPTPLSSAEATQFDRLANERIAEYQKLETQLKTATEDQKKEIREKMLEQQKAMLAESRERAARQKEDMRKRLAPAINK